MAEILQEKVNQEYKPTDKFVTRWWTQKDDVIHQHVFGTVGMIETRQNYRSLQNLKHARLYANLELLGIYAGIYTPASNDYLLPNRLTLNVIKSCIDTAASKIAKAKPRALILTDGGDWKQQRRAQKLTQYLDGAFDAGKIYEEKQKSFVDGEVFGTGALKVIKDRDKKCVRYERILIEELVIDDNDGLYGRPRSMYHKRLVNKEVIKALAPKELWPKIEEATNAMKEGGNSPEVRDLVKVIEAWHLPSSKNAKDGKHVLCLDTCTIACEPWTIDKFPFVFDRWNNKLIGFYGMGIAEELTGIQLEINKILRNIQLSMHLFAVPRVAVENGSQVSINSINNDLASILKYSGTAPAFMTPQAMAPDVYLHLWNLVSRAYEITGVSQLSAGSKKPEGLDSGAALREYQDIESDRFQLVGQRYEETFMDAAELTIIFTKELDEEFGNISIQVSDSGSMKTIKWKDVDMERDQFIMRVFPASILPTQPAGRLAKVTELVQAGFLDKETGMDLLDFPDIKAATDKMLAPRRLILKILDKMVEEGEYESPEPYMNLQLTEAIANQYYLYSRMANVPEDRLELIRRFIADTQALMKQAMPVVPGAPIDPGAAAPMEPIAAPLQAPTSDILPIG